MRIGIAIVKSTLFRGVQQEFANVYHYRLLTAVTAPSASIVNEIVAKEKAWHALVVNFKRAQVWTAGGTKQQNSMIYQTNLSGEGAGGNATQMDRERAVLIRWPAGFDSRGLPVYLRKWFHTCGNFGAHSLVANDIISNIGAIPDATRTGIASAASALNEVGATEAWDLCSPKGRVWQGQPQCHKYLEHHQLGDMWR